MTDTLAIMAPEEPTWLSFKTSASFFRLEVEFFSGIDSFLARDLPASQTVVVVDTDECGASVASVVSTLSRHGQAGVITISRSLTYQERIALICLGADHCLGLPLVCDELLALANNLFRHSHTGGETSRDRSNSDCWVLDLKQWRLTTPSGDDIGLSSGELNLLALMLEAPGRTHPRKDLLAHFGKSECRAEDRSIDVLISRLRRKVEDVTAARLPLRSARGEGYVFASSAMIIS